ncbi:MAG: hypothetical protein ACI4XR_01845 [Bacilli bacterium]
MNFKETLNIYLEKLECTSKELSIESQISQTVISRYRNGKRTPLKNSEQVKKIANAIFKISQIKEKNNYNYEKILNDFNNAICNVDTFDYESFSNNFNMLITSLNINMNEMAKDIIFDSSHISRIRNGKSRPSNPIDFSTKVCNFIISRYTTTEDIKKISSIIHCNSHTLSKNSLFTHLFSWLTSENKTNDNQINNFLNNLDTFNLNNYIKAIKFDELKVPNIPFYKGKTKHYYGIEEMKQGELNFFKATVLSKSKEDIFMCTDMPMEDMAKDIEFGKKWMFAIAMCLKKGLHLNIIHNLDRPFNELMLGLESWIPIYMTGQISPYYLNEVKNSIYQHLNYVSGTIALTGECIKGSHNKGMYYLTNNQNEVLYYKEKSKLLLKKAYSLMDIYKEENKKDYYLFLENNKKIFCNRKRYLSTLPLFTIDNELLIKILKRNNISQNDIEKIIEYKKYEKEYIENILKHNYLTDYIYEIRKKDFETNENYLLLNNMFYNTNITYTYEEYKEHLKSTKNYAKNNSKYEIIENNYKIFKNITITICENYAIIHKNANPTIHFVIRHPKLVAAIKNFNPIVKE